MHGVLSDQKNKIATVQIFLISPLVFTPHYDIFWGELTEGFVLGSKTLHAAFNYQKNMIAALEKILTSHYDIGMGELNIFF